MYEVEDLGRGPNDIHHRQLVLDETVNGMQLAVPLLALRGAGSGPTMFLLAGQHALELNGPLAVQRLLDQVSPRELRGQILAIPLANPAGFVTGSSHYPTQGPTWSMPVHWPEGGPAYPEDQSANMNRLWPGKPEGRVPEKIAHAIFTEAARGADFAIDLHCHDYWNSEVVILEAWHEPSLAFGRALGCRVNHRSRGAPNMFAGFMAGRGVPVAAIELVPIYLVSQASVAEGVRMLKNALRYAGMLPGEPEMPGVTYEFGYDAEKPVLSEATGMVSFRRTSGEVVPAGDLLAEVFDPWSFKLVQRVVAPCDCLVSRAAWNSYTRPGWPLCKVVDLKVAQGST